MKALKNVDMIDVIRALSRKSDDLEHAADQLEMYQRWYKEEREKVKALQAQLLALETKLED